MKKVEFLSAALARLKDDVGTILDLLDEHNRRADRKIGFWASIRMMMPIVEAISHVVDETPQEFLGNHLEIGTPNLAWDLFRHSLMHGDYLQQGKYQAKEVSWGVLLMGRGHLVGQGRIGIDVRTLYQGLVKYLDAEVAKDDQTIVNVETGVIYLRPKPAIVEDFGKL